MIEATYYETVCGDDDEPFTLVDSKIGVVSKYRLPYVLKQVRMNGRHIEYMLKNLQEMPPDVDQYYQQVDSLGLQVDLDSYTPSHPRYRFRSPSIFSRRCNLHVCTIITLIIIPFRLKSIMRRLIKEDLFDDPNSWDQTTWENDQERLRVLENRVKAYLLDLEKRYKNIKDLQFKDIAIPQSFLDQRDKSRVKDLNEVCSLVPESEIGDESIAPSESNTLSVQMETASSSNRSSTCTDGLLLDDTIVDSLLENAVNSLRESLSSLIVDESSQTVVEDKTALFIRRMRKKEAENAGLRAAITNAVNKGSCASNKLEIADKAESTPLGPVGSPPDSPRDPKDRRKRMRCAAVRYVSRKEVPNTLKALSYELKLLDTASCVGLNLSEIYRALELSLDKPLEDTWYGVSNIFSFDVS